jgi:integrase
MTTQTEKNPQFSTMNPINNNKDTQQNTNNLLSPEVWYPRPQDSDKHRDTSLIEPRSFLDQARLRPQQSTRYDDLIINTLIKARNLGLAENTQQVMSNSLRQLSQKTNLNDPEQVKTYIANATNQKTKQPLSNATKTKLCFAYEWLCKANGMQWQKPRYKVPEEIPIIPTTNNVERVINASTRRFTTVFTLLAEIGAEGEELHRVHKNKVDIERGKVTIEGTKGHASGTYKLKPRTTEMLREYIAKNPQDYPFPKPKMMSQIWRRVRNRLADNLKQPEPKNPNEKPPQLLRSKALRFTP